MKKGELGYSSFIINCRDKNVVAVGITAPVVLRCWLQLCTAFFFMFGSLNSNLAGVTRFFLFISLLYLVVFAYYESGVLMLVLY